MKTKHYINTALFYAVLAMAGGVFYREFTKFNHFSGKTTLGVIHTHYFLLGMVFFLLLLLLEKNFAFTELKTQRALILYHIGLNLTGIMFFIRGILQVLDPPLSSAVNSSISGVAGIGHILLGISMICILLTVRRSVAKAETGNA